MKRGKLKRSKSGGENGNSNQSHKLVSDGSTPSPAPIKRIAPFSFSVTEHAITRLRRGYVARTSRKWLDDAGAPLCPCNKKVMGFELPDELESDEDEGGEE